MGNLTFSAMCVVVFVLLYSNITLGKASRTAKTALLSFSLLIHIAFFAVSYIMYGNVAVLMLNDLRILFNILSWGSYLVYYLAAYRNHPVLRTTGSASRSEPDSKSSLCPRSGLPDRSGKASD